MNTARLARSRNLTLAAMDLGQRIAYVRNAPPLGYTKAGRPIPIIAGGDGTGEGDGGAGDGEGDGGGSAGGSAKPLAEMTPEEQAEHWKKMARKHEKAAKAAPTAQELAELRQAKTDLDKIQDANKSELEKAASRAEKAERELEKTKPDLLRLQVAIDKGVPKNLVHRLVGTTKEELEADADDLMATIGTTAGAGESNNRRSQDGGVRGSAKDTKLSARDQGLEEAKKRFGEPAKTGQTA